MIFSHANILTCVAAFMATVGQGAARLYGDGLI